MESSSSRFVKNLRWNFPTNTLLSLLTESKNEWDNFKKNKSILSDEYIKDKIKERNQARDSKNYQLADKIRNELLEKGVQIEDKDGKTAWKFK